MDRIEQHRAFFAKLITANAGVPPGSALEEAFATTPREQFVGPPPWKVYTPMGYIETPSDDPTFLYQDGTVSLGSASGNLNNGQPTLHAYSLAALNVKKGERVVHIGAGTGYYTTILAKLTGETAVVDAYEIEPELARRATANMEPFPNVTVHSISGATGVLPACDVLYVNAGATEPVASWLDVLRPNGQLLFPLTPDAGAGAMLLITRREDETYAARFLMPVAFVPCVGARSEAMAKKLSDAFRLGNGNKVRRLHRNNEPDESSWCAGGGWWLSTHE
jgi:protein-L-isoaspartate(D-aspartate) O-methyltransferase